MRKQGGARAAEAAAATDRLLTQQVRKQGAFIQLLGVGARVRIMYGDVQD